MANHHWNRPSERRHLQQLFVGSLNAECTKMLFQVMSDALMIEVQDLTKRYAGHTAVHGVSFEVGPGEIVGLLGPNGAGKSTIMRILSCYMPATSGTVRVAG